MGSAFTAGAGTFNDVIEWHRGAEARNALLAAKGAVGRAAPREPIEIEARLQIAYPQGTPKAVKEFLVGWSWPTNRYNFPGGMSASLSLQGDARAFAKSINEIADSSCLRFVGVKERLDGLENRLAEVSAQYAGVCASLAADPPLMSDPLALGQEEAVKAGCERLIPAIEREIERLRVEAERIASEAANWQVLAELADVISGFRKETDSLARDLGFEEAWQVCPAATRKKREEERAAEAERRRLESERSRVEVEKRRAEIEAADRAKQAAEAGIDAMPLEDLLGYLFFERQRGLAIEEIKRRVAKWDELRNLKEVIRLWPEAVSPDLSVAARRDISDWLSRRRIDPAFTPTTEEDLADRAARRLATVICSNR